MVRRLIYLFHTRPDIAYVASIVSQVMHSSLVCHVEVILRISRYLKVTLGKGLMFKKNYHFLVEAYTNANWVGSIMD